MRLYVELARRSFQQQFAYRGAVLAGIFTNSIFGFMIASVYLALYHSQASGGSKPVEGWSQDQTIALVWINQSLLMVVYLWGWWDVTRSIQSGAIATELLKPYNYFTYWLARDLGRSVAHILLRGIPTFVVGAVAFDLLAPQSGWRLAGFSRPTQSRNWGNDSSDHPRSGRNRTTLPTHRRDRSRPHRSRRKS